MSSWSMNDGSALTGTMTFTNGNATVSGSGTNFDPQVQLGDVIISAGGVKHRVKAVASDTSLTLTENFSGSTESGVAATVTRPPLDFNSSAPHINNNILGVSAAESLGGLDNVSTLALNVAGTCHQSAPSVTITGPTARTIAQAAIAEDATGLFTVANHGMRTGTKLTYGQDGSNTLLALGGSNVADGTAVFVVRVSDNTFGLNTNETNALAGTKLAVTNDGHDTQTFTGVTATATATISAGKVTGYTITNVGSDYQSAPSVSVAAPATETIDLTDANKLVVADDEIACSAGFYGAIETGDAVTYSKGSGGTAAAGLTDGGVHFIIKSGTSNKFSLATSATNANAGTKIDLTAVAAGGTAHTFIGTTPTANAVLGLGSDDSVDTRQIAHTGWVKKTVGTGGRAGRVHYETLVAASSISGDASDDIALPDS